MLGAGLKEAFAAGYRGAELRADIAAGLTVGVVAVPLAMALAIASGVPPQHGLYTAIVAGALIALTGGSRFSVAGPTAAFVVILHPIAVSFGVGGLLIATLMAGAIQAAMGIARFGRLIEFIPHPVTTGFTAGIAVVIASLQLNDLFGVTTVESPDHFVERLVVFAGAVPTLSWPELGVAAFTLAAIAAWSRRRSAWPPHLVGVAAATVAAFAVVRLVDGVDIATVGSRFGDIPRELPALSLPWRLPGADGVPLTLSFALFTELLRPAFAIAMLGAIESLLCAVVADGMGGSKHDPNAELVGQGLGNMVVPFFGGFAATGALARTAANVRAGARSPLAAVFHAGFVLAAVLALAPVLAHLPMAAMAALLLWIAWQMAERKSFFGILARAPKSDIAVMLVCFGLTVFIDMVLAVGVGVVLAALLFMKRMSSVTTSRVLEEGVVETVPTQLPPHVRVYEIAGPLFFGAAERAVGTLSRVDGSVTKVVLSMHAVPTMDATGLVALESAIARLNARGVAVALAGVQPQPLKVLTKAGVAERDGLTLHPSLADALRS